uniref:K Homology domain-containing protein n=1 Tax=Dulem virus 40 TaxID=3145758 RepID=A0AAU8AVT1_9CAUD
MSRSLSENIERLNRPECRLELIPTTLDRLGVVFSKTMAARIVGGRGKLGKLIEQGKVRVEKKASKQNGKWYCNGGDVIRYIKL